MGRLLESMRENRVQNFAVYSHNNNNNNRNNEIIIMRENEIVIKLQRQLKRNSFSNCRYARTFCTHL